LIFFNAVNSPSPTGKRLVTFLIEIIDPFFILSSLYLMVENGL
jgi:hypothetical protein